MKNNERIPELFLPKTPEITKALEGAKVPYRLPRCRSCNPGTNLTQVAEGHGFKISCSCGNSWQQNTPLSVSVRMVSGAEKVARQVTATLRKTPNRRMAVVQIIPDGEDVRVQFQLDPFAPGAGIEGIISGLAEPVRWYKHGLPGQMPSEVLEGSVPQDVRDTADQIKGQRKALRQWMAPVELPDELCWQAACRVEHVAFASQDRVVLVADLGGNELEDGRPSAAGIPGVVYDAVRVVKVSASPTGVLIAPYRGAIDPESRLPIEVVEDDAAPGTVFEGHPSQSDPRYRRVAWAAMKAAQDASRGHHAQVPTGWSVRRDGPRPQPRLQQPRPPQPEPTPLTPIREIAVGTPEPTPSPAPVSEPTVAEAIKAASDLTMLMADPPMPPSSWVNELPDAPSEKPAPRRRATKPAKTSARKPRRSDD